MKVVVGSKNPVKIEALENVLREYPMFSGVEIESENVETTLPDQPLSFTEIIQGAIERASIPWTKKYSYGFGIESGLVKIPVTGEMMDFSACYIHDGKRDYPGFSPWFLIPPRVANLVDNGANLSQACREAGLTNHEYVGYAEGIIGILTKGRVTRMDYTEQAIKMALISLENPELYPD